MKKYLITLILAVACLSASAQKTVIKTESFSDTQARMLDVTAKSYVRPLVVDLVVKKGEQRKVANFTYPKMQVEVGMNGNPDNLRSRAVYDAASQWGCDAVVAATFKIELSQDMTTYTVEIKGFPANFDSQSWHPMNESDFKWLQIDREVTGNSVNDPNRAGAVIRNVQR